jgi:hypothetical protein
MNRPIITCTLLLSLLTHLAFSAVAAADWEPLFDGHTLNGWRASEHPSSVIVTNGTILCDGPRAHLFYIGREGKPADFTNFEFRAEVMTQNGANSGIYFHTHFQEQGFPSRGFECQVLNVRRGDNGYRENKLSGSLYGIRNVYKPMFRDGEWVAMHIKVQGKRIQIRANDSLLVDYVEPEAEIANRPGRKLDHGNFALQCHDQDRQVFYRNLQVKRLPDESPNDARPGPALNDYEQEIVRLGAANYPVVNYHVHLKGGLTLEEALAESRRTGVFYGIALNCGLGFAVTNDDGIYDYLKQFEGKPAFVAMQAEGREWVKLFSPEAAGKFDYVFTDSMTIADENGKRMRLWMKNEVPEIKDKQAWMDMLVDRAVKILTEEPIDIYVNPTFLPEQIAAEYDQLWTRERMQKVIEAAAKRHVAIEINSRYRLPSPAFLKLAKASGCRFTFGTNNGDRDVGRLDYSFQMIKELDLKWQDIWVPEQRR